MRNWSFAERQLLAENFTLDKVSQNYVRQVPNAMFSVIKPTPFSSPVQLAGVWVHVLEDVLDMDSVISESEEFLDMVSGNKILAGSRPLCHRYGGHQFGVWADQLGDGRAHMLGEYVNQLGERWELQLKGSGLTPYSRRGDGRAVIRSSVREFLASEAMHFLGIPTSRSASLVVSRDTVWRDQFYNGHPRREREAVVLRLAKSWFRFGSFEILAVKQEFGILQELADFVIKEYFPSVDSSDPHRYLAMFSEVVYQTAAMIALWQSVGFAHGVCNTDNFSILSITIDYGPFGFLDAYDPDMVPNTSDDERRYSYEKQPDVGAFNLDKLRIALHPLLSDTDKTQMDIVLQGYANIYKTKFMEIFRKKVGIEGYDVNDEHLIALLLKMMEDKKCDFTMTFRQLGDWKLSDIQSSIVDRSLWSLHKLSSHAYFKKWSKMYYKRIMLTKLSELKRKEKMHKTNPRYILRNWIAEEAIRAAEQDDFSVLSTVQEILSRPYEEQKIAELSGYADPPPPWASDLKVSCSS